LETQLVEADLAAAAFAGVDREFDGVGVAQCFVGDGSPREVDLAFLVAHLAPFPRKHEIGAIHPPDVFAFGVGELELQRVAGRVAAHLERELIVARIVDRQLAAHRRVTGDAVEIEIKAKRLSARAVGAAQRRSDLVGCDGAPRGCVLKIIEQASRCRSVRADTARQQACEKTKRR